MAVDNKRLTSTGIRRLKLAEIHEHTAPLDLFRVPRLKAFFCGCSMAEGFVEIAAQRSFNLPQMTI